MKHIRKFFISLMALVIFASLIACNTPKTINIQAEEVRSTAASITELDLPSGYSPDFSANVMGYSMAAFHLGDGPSHLYLIQSENAADGTELEKGLNQLLPGAKDQHTRITILETLTITIRGVETSVVISEGVNSENIKYRQALAAFPGNNGPALLVFSEPLSRWDMQTVEALLASMR